MLSTSPAPTQIVPGRRATPPAGIGAAAAQPRDKRVSRGGRAPWSGSELVSQGRTDVGVMPGCRRACRGWQRCVVCSGCRAARRNTITRSNGLAVGKAGWRLAGCLRSIGRTLDQGWQAPSESDRRWSVPRDPRRGGTPCGGAGVHPGPGTSTRCSAAQGGSSPAVLTLSTTGQLWAQTQKPPLASRPGRSA